MFRDTHFTWLRRLEDACKRLSARRKTSLLVVIAFVLVARGALLSLVPPPVPGVHDEFSYLLAGQTFAAGRFTNPPHPLWQAFETFYVISQPTYSSMYPPAQGVALAVGYLLGHPWIGVYLSAALMCGAICWMLQAWVPLHWALTGGFLAALRWGIFSYWTESYWGGTIAAVGGALLAGALPRIFRASSVWPAVAFAVGLLILGNSRPFEGVVYALPLSLMLAIWMLGSSAPKWPLLAARVVLPIVAVGIVGLATMMFYFWRVTGSPVRMPYQVIEATYQLTGPFIWQPIRSAPHYRHAVMEGYFVPRETLAYQRAHTVSGWTLETKNKFQSLLFFFMWPAILPTVVALPWLCKNRKARLALLFGLVMFVGLSLEIWPMALHYPAPITGMMVLLTVQVMRWWRTVTFRGRPIGKVVSLAIPAMCAVFLSVRLGAAVLHVSVPEYGIAPWFTIAPGNLDRARVQSYLEAQPGRHLVLVRYQKNHILYSEWVHNDADIDGSKVVWARDDNPDITRRLLNYYPQRNVWTIDPEETPLRMERPAASESVASRFSE